MLPAPAVRPRHRTKLHPPPDPPPHPSPHTHTHTHPTPTRQKVPHVLGLEAQLLQRLPAVHVARGAYRHDVSVLREDLQGARRGQGQMGRQTPFSDRRHGMARSSGSRLSGAGEQAQAPRATRCSASAWSAFALRRPFLTHQFITLQPSLKRNTPHHHHPLSAHLVQHRAVVLAVGVAVEGQPAARGGVFVGGWGIRSAGWEESGWRRQAWVCGGGEAAPAPPAPPIPTPPPCPHTPAPGPAPYLMRSFSSSGSPLTGCLWNFWM